MNGRRLITGKGAAALALLLLIAGLAAWLLTLRPAGTVAVVERNGEVVLRRRLSDLREPVEETVTGANSIELTLLFAPDGAEVLAAGCPDQVCVHTGRLSRVGEAAVCVPAGVVLRMEGGGDRLDGITG